MRATPPAVRHGLWAWVLVLATAFSTGAPPLRADDSDHPVVVEWLRDLPARQTVYVPWRPGRFRLFRAGTAAEHRVTARHGALIGHLYRAPRPGPAPYAVLFAGCGNPDDGANDLWAKLWARYLRDIGVGALVIDGFNARGVDGICGSGSRLWADRRVDDAYAALDWLARQSFVDQRRVYIMGMSNGARTALLAVSTRENWRYRRFAAAIAFYPVCAAMPNHELSAPTMILFGAADNEASPADCAAYAAQRQSTHFAPRLVTYPEARHLFDVFPLQENYDRFEVTDSRVQVTNFLAALASAPARRDRKTDAPVP